MQRPIAALSPQERDKWDRFEKLVNPQDQPVR
jgi:hypothetical protein